MKTSYLILFFILFSSYLKSQTIKVDYDNSSKWFMGLNVGGTWNTTDVQNRTSVGWGLILGKSYGYKSYSPFTFDIRARYLRGFWYGQDNDTSSLSGYTGTALNGYSSQGFTVHNFQSDVHRLGLELAVHLNSVTARNGWDPYIFGGIGFTWHQTFGDLENQNDSSALYDYSSMLSSGSIDDQLNANLDEIYDSPLDGFSKNSYNVAFMPSLGIGLGYHIGKRTTLGVEHKTTFTLRDDFDGLTSSFRAKNDLYHYTSLYLKFRFRGKRPNKTVTNTPCISPVINIMNPTQNQTVTNPQFTIQATVSEVKSSNQISVTTNTGISIPFDFDINTKIVSANVLLLPGVNSYTIRVSNRCGSDSKVVSVNFLNCSLPTALFTNPSVSNSTVRTQAYTLTASINGVNSTQGINLMHNGTLVNGYSFNTTNGLLQASITLVPGVNNFSIELFNACGNNSVSTSISYDNCVTPSISMLNPSATGTTVNTATYAISALVNGITDKNLISISQNNVAISNFVYLNGKIDFSTNLISGINTFTISGSNNCGNFSETFTVNYQTCNAPIINLEYPSITGTNLTNSAISLKAKVLNVETRQNIAVTINGLALKNVTFNKSTNSIDVPITLGTIGTNTITITATNSCGVDVETSTVVYAPCTAPTISLSAMASTVNASAYNFTANITNLTSTDGLTLTLNGNPINYSFSNNGISASVNLQNGQNTFVLTAVNACGRDTKTWNVINDNCVTPSIILENPTATGITINSNTIQFKAVINGMTDNQGITLVLNNNPVSVNYQNGVITNILNLVAGTNTIKLTIQNACGFDSEELVVNYQTCDAPSLTINQPIDNNSTINQSTVQLNASVLNVNSNQGITVKLNGIGVSFQYNNNQITSTLNLQPGANTVLISAMNSCGTDVKALNINYDNCQQPQIQITNSQTTTINSSFELNASITGSNINQGLTLTHNGSIKNYNLNGNNLTANLILSIGSNLITLSSVNLCGNDTKSYTINYIPCVTPTVSISNPVTNNLTFNEGAFTFQAEAINVNSASEISLLFNGVNYPNFSFSSGQIVANLTLSAGQNTIKVTTTNSCGTDTKSISINGKSCDSPVITLVSSENVNVVSPSYNLQATILNVSTNQGVLISFNGSTVSNYSFSNGNISSILTLVNGTNTIVISSTNECGNVNKVFTINYVQPIEEEKITICHIPPGNPNNPQTLEIPASAWAAHQAHGDVLGTCVPLEEEKITICHIPPGNPNNPQTIEIPLSAWPAHQAHGDVMGACSENNNSNGSNNNNGNSGGSNTNNSNNTNQEEQKITICHIPPGNANNPQTIEIPLSAWPAHQAHGDVMGACSENNNSNGSNNNNGNSGGSNTNNSNNTNQEEQKITICHIPPGNANNPQTIEIPLSAWPAHQAHGDVMGACSENNNSNGSNNNNANSGGTNTNNSNNTNQEEQKITICHIPPGNPNNPQTIEIPLSAWPAHQAHGDAMGACLENNNSNGSNNNNGNSGGSNNQENGNSNESNNNQGETHSNGNNGSTSQTITICHKHQGRMGNDETMTITIEEWPEHEAHGDFIGTCSDNESVEDNSNENNTESENTNPETNGNNNQENGGSGNNGSGNGKRSQQTEGNNSNKPTVNPNANKTDSKKPNSNTNQNNSNSGNGNNSKNNTNKPNPNVNKPNPGNQSNPNVNKPKPDNKEPEEKKPETPKIKKG